MAPNLNLESLALTDRIIHGAYLVLSLSHSLFLKIRLSMRDGRCDGGQRRVAFTAPTEAARSSRPGKGGQWVNQIGSLAGAQPKGLINKPTVP